MKHNLSEKTPVLSEKIAVNGRNTEIQKYGTVTNRPLALDHKVRLANAGSLNQILADTMTLRDMYKKHHWQVSGPTFYQLHLLFDKHFGEQAEIVDALAERIQTLGGVTIAMAHDVAETTRVARPGAAKTLPCSCSGCCRLTSSSLEKPARRPEPRRRTATMEPTICW